MRPGKLFIPTASPIYLFPTIRVDSGPPGTFSTIGLDRPFFVIDPKPEGELKKVANWYDLHRPWLVLYREKVWLAEIDGKLIFDVTPYAPWDKDYEHNAIVLENYKRLVRPFDD
jgi:hypothetical protein